MKSTKQKLPSDPRYVFYTIAGEVTYVDQVPPEGELPVFKTTKANMLYRGSDQGVKGKELARIQANFEVDFQNEYASSLAAVTKVVPEVVKVVILSIIPLGIFTQAEFGEGIDLPLPPEAEPGKKK